MGAKKQPSTKSQIKRSGEMTTLDRLLRSRIQLLLHFPFFGQLAMYLEFKESERTLTAGTDGKSYFYNKEFIDSLNEKELNFLTAHEVLHPALGHMRRKGKRNRAGFNIAADLVINAMIKELDPNERFFKMPAGGMYDKKFEGMHTEEAYEKLMGDAKYRKLVNQIEKMRALLEGGGMRTFDDHDMWDEGSGENDGLSDEWQERLFKCANSTDFGKLPGTIRRYLEELLSPQKNWRQLLSEFIELETSDYGFCPPDKRLMYADIYLPDWSEQEEAVKDIVFAIDTSGSISQQIFDVFLSEVLGCMAQFGDKIKGTLIYCDAAIPKNGVYDLSEAKDSIPVGGGGTNFTPVFDWVRANLRDQCCGVVYLTDGVGIFPDYKPPYPTLWVLTNGTESLTKVPFGQKTVLTTEQM